MPICIPTEKLTPLIPVKSAGKITIEMLTDCMSLNLDIALAVINEAAVVSKEKLTEFETLSEQLAQAGVDLNALHGVMIEALTHPTQIDSQ